MSKKYYAYDHYNEDRLIFKDFGKFMDWIDNVYDKERYSVQDCLSSHRQCCWANDVRFDAEEML